MESRMMNYGIRMYDPALGRFLSVDRYPTVWVWQGFRSLSPYQYAYNSPLSYKDPTGLAPQKEQGEKVLNQANPDMVQQCIEISNALRAEFDYYTMTMLRDAFELQLSSALWEIEKIRQEFASGGAGGGGSNSDRGGTNESNNGTIIGGLVSSLESAWNWLTNWITSDNSSSGPSEWVWNGIDYGSREAIRNAFPQNTSEHQKNPNYIYTGEVLIERDGYKDLTNEINNHLNNIENVFALLGTLSDLRGDTYYEKVALFGQAQYVGRRTDFLNPKQTKKWGKPNYCYNRLIHGDDFGNLSYGVAARAMGLDLSTALYGAGAFSTLNHILNLDFYKINLYNPYFFDDWHDSYWIIVGYRRKR